MSFQKEFFFELCLWLYLQGIPTSVLRLPINIALEGNSGYDVTSVTVGALANQTQSDPYEEPFGMIHLCLDKNLVQEVSFIYGNIK